MGLEIVFFLGALLLVAGPIYGIVQNRHRVRAAGEITGWRYRSESSAEAWPVDMAPPDTVPSLAPRSGQPVGIEPEFSEEDKQRAQFGPRGVPGAADPAKTTPQRAKTPGNIDPRHVS